jgi:putative intracellular protease/amidase
MSQTRSRPRKIAIIGYDGVQSLDVTGPFEVFAIANRFGGQAAYDRTP